MTDVAVVSSSLGVEKETGGFRRTPISVSDLVDLQTMSNALKTGVEGVKYQPEIPWIVDPNDYLKPMVFDPSDTRWENKG